MDAGWLMRRQCCRGDKLHGYFGQVMLVEKVWSDLGKDEDVNQRDLMIDPTDSVRGALREGLAVSCLLSCADQDVCC